MLCHPLMTHPSIYPPTPAHPPTRPSACPSIHPPTHPSISQSIHPPIHPPFRQGVWAKCLHMPVFMDPSVVIIETGHALSLWHHAFSVLSPRVQPRPVRDMMNFMYHLSKGRYFHTIHHTSHDTLLVLSNLRWS